MISQKRFDAFPPCPESAILPADVPKFSLSKRSSGDCAYAHGTIETCCTTGFFLLKMGGEETGDIMTKEIDALFDISSDVFGLDTEKKIRYARDASKGEFIGCVASTLLNSEIFIGIDTQIVRGVGRDGMTNSSLDGRMSA